MEGVVSRRTTLAAIVAACILAGGHVQSPAQSTMGDGATPQSPSEAGHAKPAEGTPKSDEHGERPSAHGAQKPAEDGAAKHRLVSILGREVVNREGDGGRIIDVLVDLNGRSGAVVVEFGGFMGIGSRKVAVDWDALRFVREDNRIELIVDISREQIRKATEYKAGEPSRVLGAK
jgi:hypothetical protein